LPFSCGTHHRLLKLGPMERRNTSLSDIIRPHGKEARLQIWIAAAGRAR
jgi:hypothetical protein